MSKDVLHIDAYCTYLHVTICSLVEATAHKRPDGRADMQCSPNNMFSVQEQTIGRCILCLCRGNCRLFATWLASLDRWRTVEIFGAKVLVDWPMQLSCRAVPAGFKYMADFLSYRV